MFEIRSSGIRPYLIAPFAGLHAPVTFLSLILLAASEWFLLVAVIWLVGIEWRASRLRLRADESGITVVNYFRRYEIDWREVRGLWAGAIVRVERRRGRLWGVDAHVTARLSKLRRREVALRIAEVGRSYGYGFPTGDNEDIDALRRAGLFDETDPEAHQAYWDAREPLT
jgi:hypothetical protein